MLKKIDVDLLRPGMFVHGVCGSWLDSPFWRRRFPIENLSQIERLLHAGIEHCWIDLARGLDVLAPDAIGAREPRASTLADVLRERAAQCVRRVVRHLDR